MECPTNEMDGLAERLYRLLKEQLTATRQGNLSRVEQLGELTNAVVAQIAACGGLGSLAPPARRAELERLYGEFLTLLGAQQADVQDKLRQVRQVKRAVGAYTGKRK